VDVEVFWT
jgi:hypothetical protein